jgi:hypothetical protein
LSSSRSGWTVGRNTRHQYYEARPAYEAGASFFHGNGLAGPLEQGRYRAQDLKPGLLGQTRDILIPVEMSMAEQRMSVATSLDVARAPLPVAVKKGVHQPPARFEHTPALAQHSQWVVQKLPCRQQEHGADAAGAKYKLPSLAVQNLNPALTSKGEQGRGWIDAQRNAQGLSKTAAADSDLKPWLGQLGQQRP